MKILASIFVTNGYAPFRDYGPSGAYPSQSKLWAPPTHGCVGADGLEKEHSR